MRHVASAVALLSLAFGCGEPTSIEVELATDLPCERVRVVTTSIAAGTPSDYESRPAVAVTTRCDAATGRIGSLVLVPSGADDDVVALRIVTARANHSPDECSGAVVGPNCIVARRVVQFIPNHAVTLPINMQNACSGITCGAGETCMAGRCVTAEASSEPPPAPAPDTQADASTDAAPPSEAPIAATDDAGAPAGLDSGAPTPQPPIAPQPQPPVTGPLDAGSKIEGGAKKPKKDGGGHGGDKNGN